MKVGVLSLQGDVSEHVDMTENAMMDLGLEGEIVEVRSRGDIKDVNALIIPGGESTTLRKLLGKNGLDNEIKKLADRGAPIMGTCAGLILLGKGNGNSLGLMDIQVKRNAFGRQRESFEVSLKIPEIGRELYHAVFIRAPVIEKVDDKVRILARYDGGVVMTRQSNLIAVAFHPELTSDNRIHRYFLDLLRR
jgi:5'-phosphate synthase pdxT subunit